MRIRVAYTPIVYAHPIRISFHAPTFDVKTSNYVRIAVAEGAGIVTAELLPRRT